MGGQKRGEGWLGGNCLVAVSVLAVVASFFAMTGFQQVGYSHRDLRCINYLVRGELYGGQPECVQPPMMYFFGAFYSLFSEDAVQPMANATVVFANIACLYCLLLLVGAKKSAVNAALALTYCLLIMPLTVGHLDTTLAFFFLAAGVYILFEGSSVGEKSVASLLFVLAAASKLTVLAGVAGVVAAYFIRERKRRGGQRMFGRDLALFLAPLILTALAVNLLYPNFFIYTVLSHSHTEKLGFVGAVAAALSSNPLTDYGLLVFYGVAALVFLHYRSSRDVFCMAYLVSVGIGFIYRYKAWGSSPLIFESYYLVYPLFFLLVVFGRFLGGLSSRRIFLGCIVGVLAAATLGTYHFMGGDTLAVYAGRFDGEYQRLKADTLMLQSIVDGFYAVIPEGRGRILVNDEIYAVLSRINSSLDPSRIDNRNNPPAQRKYLDVAFVPGLEYHGVIKTHSMGLYPMELELAKNISSGMYGGIFIGPKALDSQIMYALSAVPAERVFGKCRVILPYFTKNKNDRIWSTIIFDDVHDCALMRDAAFDWGDMMFDEVCVMDEWVANNMMYGILLYNYDISLELGGLKEMQINRKCKSEADVLDAFGDAEDSTGLKRGLFAFFAASLIIITGWRRVR